VKRSRDEADAALWLVAAALLLVLVPVGWVSADAVGQADTARAGFSKLNPNHLLEEPLNAAWLALTGRWAPAMLPVDRLRRLSGLWAALSIGAFRRFLAPQLAPSRAAANYGTAWFAGCAVCLILALAADTHILQLAPAVLAAALLLRLVDRARARDALALGAALGLAALCFVSTALLAAAALCLSLRRLPGESSAAARTRTLGTAAGFLLVTLPSFWLAWRGNGGNLSFQSWLTGYGGAPGLGRLAAVYGLHDVSAAGNAALRMLYGAAKSVVDLIPAITQWRDQGLRAWPLLRVAVAGLALWALCGGFLHPDRRKVWIVVAFVVPATLLFAFLWNNSEEQFFAPLAIAIGALAARGGLRSRSAILAGALALVWNTADVTGRIVLYPRGERLARLAQLAQAVVGHGGKVVVLDIYDRPPFAPPWKFLRSLDYDPRSVRAALDGLPFTGPPRRSGPWTVRETAPAGPTPTP